MQYKIVPEKKIPTTHRKIKYKVTAYMNHPVLPV